MKVHHLVLGLLVFCACCAENEQVTLHNGIVLAEQWPPRYSIPERFEQMPVPYLENKPEVIPVNVGRQLFVDDFLIAGSDMRVTYHSPDFFSGNPVLAPSAPWEQTTEGAPYCAPFSDGIWYDPAAGMFKLWYLAGAGSLHKESNQTFYTGYAQSQDGIHWEKPLFDIYPGTNIVNTANRDCASVVLDRREKDPAKRFKLLTAELGKEDKKRHLVLRYSPDGINWSEPAAESGVISARSTVFYNPFREVWCLSMRHSTPLAERSRYYSENKDLIELLRQAHLVEEGQSDENVVFWFTPDDKEPRHPEFPEHQPEIYNFDCMAYESIILGQYAVWQGPVNDICKELGIQKKNEVFLGYSRDGFHFSRPSHEAFMAVNESDGAWNWGNMQSINGTPLIVGDSLYFYSSGRAKNDIMWDSHSSTGLAKLRRDGFISRDAGVDKEYYLTTEKLSFDGRYLFVNAAVRGSLKVELLDERGRVVRGYSKDEFVEVRDCDATKIRLEWRERKELKVRGPVRLKFYMTDGELYSFWISPWESGESRGYLAGGGPGLNESGFDIK